MATWDDRPPRTSDLAALGEAEPEELRVEGRLDIAPKRLAAEYLES